MNEKAIPIPDEYLKAANLYHNNLLVLENNNVTKSDFFISIYCPQNCYGEFIFYANDTIDIEPNGHFEFIINDVSEKCDDRKMEEALKLFVDFLFISFPIHKICYKTNQRNINTIKILMKLGFEVEACLKQDIYLGGEYVDKIVLAIFRK
jgi:hypothetical protein